MFSYYGSKSKVIHCYPRPIHDKIIEPFAGSARYSIKYFDRDVTHVDKYETIIKVWEYLKSASKYDILGLPKMKIGDNVDNYDLSIPEKYFLGFLICRGVESPRKNVSSFVGDISSKLKQISNNLYKIRHWNIIHGSYEDINNIEATWFIDPPYQFGGEHYIESTKNIDFEKLGNYCKGRLGQVIVCENTKANWLDFRPIKNMQGSKHKTTEAIWSNLPTNYDAIQQKLF